MRSLQLPVVLDFQPAIEQLQKMVVDLRTSESPCDPALIGTYQPGQILEMGEDRLQVVVLRVHNSLNCKPTYDVVRIAEGENCDRFFSGVKENLFYRP